jgi:hypothetical protein
MDRDSNLAIEWDCTKLLVKFYRLLDEKRYTELSELFAEDGAWVRLGIELTGPKAIRDAMQEREDWLTAHLLTNVEITVTGSTTAETSQYITLYRVEGYDPAQGPAEVLPPMGVLRHRDQLVRVSGEWKFKRKSSKAVLVNRGRITHYNK